MFQRRMHEAAAASQRLAKPASGRGEALLKSELQHRVYSLCARVYLPSGHDVMSGSQKAVKRRKLNATTVTHAGLLCRERKLRFSSVGSQLVLAKPSPSAAFPPGCASINPFGTALHTNTYLTLFPSDMSPKSECSSS